MKASAFSYARATSVVNALELLATHGDGAKLLSGGQSLMPAMNLRLISPEFIVDISEISELRGIEVSHETVREWETKLLPVMGDALRKRRHGLRRLVFPRRQFRLDQQWITQISERRLRERGQLSFRWQRHQRK